MTKKYYKHRGRPEKWEVLYEDHEAVLLQCKEMTWTGTGLRKQIVYRQYLSEWWEDYKEPVVNKIRRSVSRGPNGYAVSKGEYVDPIFVIGEIEITVTNDKLTAVKIVD